MLLKDSADLSILLEQDIFTVSSECNDVLVISSKKAESLEQFGCFVFSILQRSVISWLGDGFVPVFSSKKLNADSSFL